MTTRRYARTSSRGRRDTCTAPGARGRLGDSGRRCPARVAVAAGGYGAGDATAAAQQEVSSYQVSGLRTPATTCRIASVTSSG